MSRVQLQIWDMGQIGELAFLFALGVEGPALGSRVADFIVECKMRTPHGLAIAQNLHVHIRLRAPKIGIDDEVELKIERLASGKHGAEQGRESLSFKDQGLIGFELIHGIIHNADNHCVADVKARSAVAGRERFTDLSTFGGKQILDGRVDFVAPAGKLNSRR